MSTKSRPQRISAITCDKFEEFKEKNNYEYENIDEASGQTNEQTNKSFEMASGQTNETTNKKGAN